MYYYIRSFENRAYVSHNISYTFDISKKKKTERDFTQIFRWNLYLKRKVTRHSVYSTVLSRKTL